MSETEQELYEKKIEALRDFQHSAGFKVLQDIAQTQVDNSYRAFITGEKSDHETLLELRAEAKAWDRLVGLINFEIETYDVTISNELRRSK